MARSSEMVEKIDNRELSPASQPADLSQAGVTPDSYYADQAADRDASAPDDGAPRAGGVETAQDLPPPSGAPAPQASGALDQSVVANAETTQQAELELGLGATAPDGQGGSTQYDIAVGAQMETDTVAGLGQSSASGSGLNPELLREEDGTPAAENLGQITDPDGLAGATSDVASFGAPVAGTLAGALDAAQGATGQVSGVVADAVSGLGVAVETDVSEVLGSATDAGSVVTAAVADLGGVASDALDGIAASGATGGLLGGLFDPGSDQSGLDDMLATGAAATGADVLTGDEAAVGLIDSGGLDLGSSLLGADDLEDGLGGLL